jgi:DNA-binding MarR family transcriptional regulator
MRCEKSCGFLIKQIHDAICKRVNNELRANNLTLTQVRVLMELWEEGGNSIALKELERRFRVAQSTVVGIVQRLEVKGFVEGFTAPEDNRVKLVKLTQKGKKFREKHVRAINEMEKQLIACLSEDERRDFLRMLCVVNENAK